MSSRALKLALPLVLLAVGVVAAVLLASARSAPPRVERESPGPLVEVIRVDRVDVPVAVDGHGEVVPKVAVDVVPQVAGKVIQVHPALVAGGFFSADDPLLVIEPRDYELAVDRAEAAVARARVQLERELAEADVARQEWDALHPGEEPDNPLVVREPQVRQARAELEAARADLDQAELSLERTRVSVPFDGVVASESVDVGQYVAPGTPVARVYATGAVEVRVPLESRELAWFEVPVRAGDAGPRAEVRASFAGSEHVWSGRVTRMEAQVDASSRMVHVIVEVPRPYRSDGGRPPLLPGAFVDVSIEGSTMKDVVPVPRHAVRTGGSVWVVEDGQLRIRPVDVARADRDRAYVASGLHAGDLVVTSALDAVTDGMKVRPAGDGADEAGIPPDAGEDVGIKDEEAA